MIDYGTRQTDLAVKRAQGRLQRVYKQAARDIEDKMKAWQKGHEAREAKYRQQVADGTMTQADFDAWMRGQVFQGKQWQARKEQIQKTLLEADQAAAQIVNEGKLDVFATNANYVGYELEHNAKVNTGFTLYDEQTVARLVKNDPKLLPPAKVKKSKAFPYYNKLVNSCITQGIVQGETIPQIARRIMDRTGESAYKSAVRNARTAFTGAQNAGRMEGMYQAEDLGIRVQKQWMATLDDRTRDTHADLDGQIVDVDEPFVTSDGNEIMFPGDPSADPSEVYNCRCTLVYVYPDYPSDMGRRDNETGDVIGSMTYDEWEKSKSAPTINEWRQNRADSAFAMDSESRRDMGEIVSTFQIRNPIISKRDITEFYQYAEQTGGMWTVKSGKTVQQRMTLQTSKALDELADKLTSRIREIDEETQQDYKDLKQIFRQTPLFISKEEASNFADFDLYKKSKGNYVRLTNARSAIGIDEVYPDLLESFPGRFDPEADSPTEMLKSINAAMAEMEAKRDVATTDTMSEEEIAEMQSDLRDFLIAGFEAAKER